MKVYVNVYLYQAVIDAVEIFTTEKESEEDFEGNVGMKREVLYKEENEENDFHGSNIFILNLDVVPNAQFEIAMNWIAKAIAEFYEFNPTSEIAQELDEIHTQLHRENRRST